MTYLQMLQDQAKSLSLRINYELRMNDGCADEAIKKLMDEYSDLRDQIQNEIVLETKGLVR